MGDASYIQTSFLGGEWSPLIQGRMDDPRYRTGMNVARNTLPIEEGSAVRRPGTHLIGPTRKGAKAVLRAFDFAESHPYNLELTAGHMRLLAGLGIVVESFGTQVVIDLAQTDPVTVETLGPHGWSDGDEVVCLIQPGQVNATIAGLLGRQLEIRVGDSTHFTVYDSVTDAPIDGTTMVLGDSAVTVTRIADFTTPYGEADLEAINHVQDQTDLLLLHNVYPPQAIVSTTPEEGSDFAVFNFNPAVFKDGPYLDPPTDGTTIASSGLSGSVTLTLAGGSTRFVITDVNRQVRMFSEPALWSNVTLYAVGAQVKFNDEYYQAIKANTGKQPDADVVNWGVATGAAAWTWATVTSFTDSAHVTATIEGEDILRTTACAIWRLGLFSDTTGYPANGTYHEGRLWLAGVIGNRIDGSVSNDPFNFEPTSVDGTVADNNACAYVFNAKDVNQVFWMEPDAQGIICGTQAGEWLVQASSTNDNLTPTSVQAHRRTNYGCANVPAKRTGLSIAFVQRYNKKLLEYITTDYRGLSAHNIAQTGKHLTQKGIVEIAYQAEKVPTIWVRTADNVLLSCTYKRTSPYASDPPDMAGWAHHDLGHGLTVESIQAGPNYDGTLDALTVVVSDGTSRWINIVTDLFDVDWTIGDANFVDFSETPSMWEIIEGTPDVIRLYSLHYLAGQSVDVFAGGIDCGTLTVAADGHLDIPIDSTTIPLLTSDWLASLSSATNFHGLGIALVRTPPGLANVPVIAGVANFDSLLLGTGAFGPGTNYTSDASMVDWDGGRFFISNPVDRQIQINDIKTLACIQPPKTLTVDIDNMTYGEDGHIYAVTGAGNCAILHKIDPKSMGVLASFGIFSGATTSSANTMLFPRDMDVVNAPGGPALVSCSFLGAFKEATVIMLGSHPRSGMAWAGFNLALAEPYGVVCKGLNYNGLGQAWILTTSGDEHGGAALGLYQILIRGSTGVAGGRKVADLQATDFGAPFTHITTVSGIFTDETDGNIIVQATASPTPNWSGATAYAIGSLVNSAGHDYVAIAPTTGELPASHPAAWQDLGVVDPAGSSSLIAKIDHQGNVLWTKVIGAATIGTMTGIADTRVRFGHYVFKDNAGGNGPIYDINTLTGVTTTRAQHAVSGSYQFYNDYTGELIVSCTYLANPADPDIPVPIGLTPTSWLKQWATFGPAAGPVVPAAIPPADGVTWTVPVAIGFTYPSQGQILRAILPQESGAQNGPALGKTRRTHMYSALLQRTQGISVGTTFDALYPAQLMQANNVPIALTTLYSGVQQDTLEDDYTFDSMLCWEIDRPYPATVCTLGAFIHTQDR